MTTWLLVGMALFSAGGLDAKKAPEPANKDHIQFFTTLGAEEEPSPEIVQEVIRVLDDEAVTDKAWQDMAGKVAAKSDFTPASARLWQAVIMQMPNPARAAFASAMFAAATIAKRIAALTPDSVNDNAPFFAAISWLPTVTAQLTPERLAMVGETIAQAVKEKPLDLVPFFAPDREPPLGQVAAQICFGLASCFPRDAGVRSRLTEIVRLPDTMRQFLLSTRVLLFDGGALDPVQLASLDSVLRSLPPSLHMIDAVTVEGALAMAAPGQVLFVSPIPMDLQTNPREFATRSGGPIAPQFTAAAAAQVVRAVQAIQFMRRPELAARRNALLARLDTRATRIVRLDVPPAFYLYNPDELLPSVGYLWCINSAAAFQMAIDQIRLRERGLLEATLLLADMLSGGGPSVPAFTIAPDGLMTGGMAALSRAIPDVLPEDEFATMATRTPGPVNGIEILGQFWRFPVDMTGGIVDTRWNGAFP